MDSNGVTYKTFLPYDYCVFFSFSFRPAGSDESLMHSSLAENETRSTFESKEEQRNALQNMTALLNELLRDYDNKLRPNFGSEYHL